jgi:hypothetical protein
MHYRRDALPHVALDDGRIQLCEQFIERRNLQQRSGTRKIPSATEESSSHLDVSNAKHETIGWHGPSAPSVA